MALTLELRHVVMWLPCQWCYWKPKIQLAVQVKHLLFAISFVQITGNPAPSQSCFKPHFHVNLVPCNVRTKWTLKSPMMKRFVMWAANNCVNVSKNVTTEANTNWTCCVPLMLCLDAMHAPWQTLLCNLCLNAHTHQCMCDLAPLTHQQHDPLDMKEVCSASVGAWSAIEVSASPKGGPTIPQRLRGLTKNFPLASAPCCGVHLNMFWPTDTIILCPTNWLLRRRKECSSRIQFRECSRNCAKQSLNWLWHLFLDERKADRMLQQRADWSAAGGGLGGLKRCWPPPHFGTVCCKSPPWASCFPPVGQKTITM